MPHWGHSLLHWLSLHWGDVVPTWLAVIVAAVFGVQARTAEAEAKAQAERAERATKAAEDAAVAAKETASALGRSATAHETQAQLAQDQADEAQQKPWRIERPGDYDFRLVNLTKTPKYDVAVTGQPAKRNPNMFRMGGGRSNSFDVVDGADTVELDLVITAQTLDRSVTVSWRPTSDHTGDPSDAARQPAAGMMCTPIAHAD